MAKAIKTTDKNVYKGRKEAWTEPQTDSFSLSQEMTFVHKSHRKISAFEVGVTTCVFDEYASESQLSAPLKTDVVAKYEVIIDFTEINDNTPEYVYLMTVPAGTPMSEHDNEYRFEMSHDVKISLIGEMGRMRIKDDSYETYAYGGHTINVFTKKY